MPKTAKKAAKQPATVVELHSAELGVTRPFNPAHAARLLAWQVARGRTDWQPVKAAEVPTE